MIKFHCPNGHPLNAPDNLAGKPGKCPKCDQPFIVPQPDELGVDPATVAAASSAVTPAMGSGKNLVSSGEIFVFLCPNGHKLNGPPSLKGRPGQCPHCKARFLIPTDEDIEAAAAEEAAGDEDSPDAEQAAGIDFNRFLGSQNAEDTAGDLALSHPP